MSIPKLHAVVRKVKQEEGKIEDNNSTRTPSIPYTSSMSFSLFDSNLELSRTTKKKKASESESETETGQEQGKQETLAGAGIRILVTRLPGCHPFSL